MKIGEINASIQLQKHHGDHHQQFIEFMLGDAIVGGAQEPSQDFQQLTMVKLAALHWIQQ